MPATGFVPSTTSGRSFGVLRQVVPWVVSLSCLGALVWLFWDQFPTTWRALQTADPSIMVLAALVYLATFYVLAMRIKLVFGAFGIVQSSFRFFLYSLIGLFFSNFLPTAMGGDVLKAGYATERADQLADGLLATLTDRAIGFLSMILIGFAGLAFFPDLALGTSFLWVPVVVILCLAVAIVACRCDPLVEWALSLIGRLPLAARLQVPRLLRLALGVLRSPLLIVQTLLLTLVAVTLSSTSLWILGRALQIELGYLVFFLLIPVITIASLVPSINGMGVREATFVVVLRGLVPQEQALALAITFYALAVVCSIVGGLVFLLRKRLGLRLNPDVTRRLS